MSKAGSQEAASVGLQEAWETTVASDTPHYRHALSSAERDAVRLQRTAAHLLALAQQSLKASEAAAAARSELAQALSEAGGSAFAHHELRAGLSAGSAPPLSAGALLDMFGQLGMTETMQMRQVQSLLIEPLEALLDEPRGLCSIARTSSAYATVSHDFYEALDVFLALDGDGASASAAKAHAKTTAKAAGKAGAALASTMGSRIGAGFGVLGRRLNQLGGKIDELTGERPPPPPPPPSSSGMAMAAPAEADPEEEPRPPNPRQPGAEAAEPGGLLPDAAVDAIADIRSGDKTLADSANAVTRHQEAMLKTRHALECRLVESSQRARASLAKLLCDYFYTQYSHVHQQTTVLDRQESSLRSMQQLAEGGLDAVAHTRAGFKQAAAQLTELCSHLSTARAHGGAAIPDALLPAFEPHVSRAPPPAAAEAEKPAREGVLFVQQGLLRQWRRCWCVISAQTLTIYRLPAKYAGAADVSAERWRERKVCQLQLTLCNVKPVRSGASGARYAIARGW